MPYIEDIASPFPSRMRLRDVFALPLDGEDLRVPQNSDGLYLKHRARQSLAAKSVATDRSARLAHSQLAAAYAERAVTGELQRSAEDAEAEPPEPDAPLMAWANPRKPT
jgi:hypothetical protein